MDSKIIGGDHDFEYIGSGFAVSKNSCNLVVEYGRISDDVSFNPPPNTEFLLRTEAGMFNVETVMSGMSNDRAMRLSLEMVEENLIEGEMVKVFLKTKDSPIEIKFYKPGEQETIDEITLKIYDDFDTTNPVKSMTPKICAEHVTSLMVEKSSSMLDFELCFDSLDSRGLLAATKLPDVSEFKLALKTGEEVKIQSVKVLRHLRPVNDCDGIVLQVTADSTIRYGQIFTLGLRSKIKAIELYFGN